jgi:hypothetical protein
MLKFLKISVLVLPIAMVAAGCAVTSEQPQQQLAGVDATEERAHRVRPATGSRIPIRTAPDGRVISHLSAPVVSYDRETLRSTGHRDLEQALFLLDPNCC